MDGLLLLQLVLMLLSWTVKMTGQLVLPEALLDSKGLIRARGLCQTRAGHWCQTRAGRLCQIRAYTGPQSKGLLDKPSTLPMTCLVSPCAPSEGFSICCDGCGCVFREDLKGKCLLLPIMLLLQGPGTALLT